MLFKEVECKTFKNAQKPRREADTGLFHRGPSEYGYWIEFLQYLYMQKGQCCWSEMVHLATLSAADSLVQGLSARLS